MHRHPRILMTIRIVVLILVGLAFLIARLAKAQQPAAAEMSKKETVASAFLQPAESAFLYPSVDL